MMIKMDIKTGTSEFSNHTIDKIFSTKPKFITQWHLSKEWYNLCKYLKGYNKCKNLLESSELRLVNNTDNIIGLWNGLDLDTGQLKNYNETILKSNLTNLNESSLLNDDIPAFILPPFNLWQTIAIGLCLALCIILTVGGNILVLLAFIVDRNIRQPSNYFIASLAATDILIGTISMPFYTIYVLMGYWDLGVLVCDLWLSVDYTVCLVSQYTVLLITIDRYCSVKIAAKYRSWRTKKRVIYMVSITWTIPTLLFFISIFGWEHFTGKRDLLPGQCAVQFLKDPIFNTVLIISYYWTTLIVLFILYGGIYKTAYDMQKRNEAKKRKMHSMVALSAGAMSGMAGRAMGLGIKQERSCEIVSSKNNVNDSNKYPNTKSIKSSKAIMLKEEDLKTNFDEILIKNQIETDNRKKKEQIESGDIEKSERSSSPAFDSDEDSSVNRTLQITFHKKTNINLHKRPSTVGLLFGAKNTLRTNLVSETFSPKLRLKSKRTSTDLYIQTNQLNVGWKPRNSKSSIESDTQNTILNDLCNECTLSSPEHLSSHTFLDYTKQPVKENILNDKTILFKLLEINESTTNTQDFQNETEKKMINTENVAEEGDSNNQIILKFPSVSVTTTTTTTGNSSNANTSDNYTCAPDTGSSSSSKNTNILSATEQIISQKQCKAINESRQTSEKRHFMQIFGDHLKYKKTTFSIPITIPMILGAERKKSKSENRARKALRTISFILGCFVACWTPYHVLALVEGFCRYPPCINEHLYMFSYFLCYANSPMNPFCYALANQQFKKTFIRLLKGDFHIT